MDPERGRIGDLDDERQANDEKAQDQDDENGGRRVLGPRGNRLEPRPHVISEEELTAHGAYVEAKIKDALWLGKQEA